MNESLDKLHSLNVTFESGVGKARALSWDCVCELTSTDKPIEICRKREIEILTTDAEITNELTLDSGKVITIADFFDACDKFRLESRAIEAARSTPEDVIEE